MIYSGGKYVIKQVGYTAELKITDLKLEDAGDYTCDCGDSVTTATVKVNGRRKDFFRFQEFVYTPHF